MEKSVGGQGGEEESLGTGSLREGETNEEVRDPDQSEGQGDEPMEIDAIEILSSGTFSNSREETGIRDLRQVIRAR